VEGKWFYLYRGTLRSPTKKYDIIELLLKVSLKTRNNSLSGTNIKNINDRGT